jgi:hypothetical protein
MTEAPDPRNTVRHEAPGRELAEEPGRPRGRDEVDAELLVLPRPRPRVGPLLALSVVVFCVYFLVRLRSDLVFAHSGPDPAEVTGIAGAMAGELDSYVELREAVPDRAAILRVFASEARDGHRLAPVLGSGDRLWLLFGGSHWTEPPAYDERVRGRLKRLADLPFRDELVAELARTRLPRALDPGDALAALAARRKEVRDLSGDMVAAAADAPVTVVERAVGEARVTAFATDRYPDENAWRAALARAGLVAPGARLDSATDASWSFRVAAPNGVEPVAAALVAARLFAARAEPVDRTHHAAWRDLSASGGDLVVAVSGGPPERVPAAGITALLIETERRAPTDARVIVMTDRPGDYWHVTVLYVLFALLAAVFAWAFVRGLRRE